MFFHIEHDLDCVCEVNGLYVVKIGGPKEKRKENALFFKKKFIIYPYYKVLQIELILYRS